MIGNQCTSRIIRLSLLLAWLMCHWRSLYDRVIVLTISLSLSPPPFPLSLPLWQLNDDKKLRESDRQRKARVKWFFRRDLFMTRHKSQARTKSFVIYRPCSAAGRSAKKLDRNNQLLMTVTRNLLEWVFEEFVCLCFTTCRNIRLTFQRADIVMFDVIIADAGECAFIVISIVVCIYKYLNVHMYVYINACEIVPKCIK